MGEASLSGGRAPGRLRQRAIVPEDEIGEIVYDVRMGAVLFIDFKDAAVFSVAGRKDPGRFAGQEDAGVGAAAVGEAANDDHGTSLHGRATKSNPGRRRIRCFPARKPPGRPARWRSLFNR